MILVPIMLLVIAALFFFAAKSMKSKKQWTAVFKKEYGEPQDMLRMGALVSGHPEVDERVPLCGAFIKGKGLHLLQYYDELLNVKPKPLGVIPCDAVSNVLVEDQSTIEKRITATRMILVGVFALAWRKKTKKELAYLTIFWNKGKFENETVFEFESKDSLARANKLRNAIINKI